MSLAARSTTPAQETFSEFPITPTDLILSGNLFNQRQEFLIAGRSAQRRFRDPRPAQARLAGHEFFELVQHPLVNGRVPDYSGAAVGFSLASFELGLD